MSTMSAFAPAADSRYFGTSSAFTDDSFR